MKKAIIQCADQGPVESIVVMLRSVGYECYLPSEKLKRELRSIGHKLVLDISSLVKGMGYEWPIKLPEADLADMERPDVLYVDVKAHQCYDAVVRRWPNLKGRVLWYRIQGGKPEHVIKPSGEDCGDEANPPCPVLTPNLWYREPGPWRDRSYACWPPFYRFDDYDGRYNGVGYGGHYTEPVCLIHNVSGWGYQALIDNMRSLGVKCYGASSPDGLIQHAQVKGVLASALCMVHLKSSDAPGYAIFESLAAACPIICTRRLIWRNRMSDLFIPGETCLVFDRETHDGLSAKDVEECTAEVKNHLARLRDPGENQRVGRAGRERLKALMWDENRDAPSLREFMQRVFPEGNS